MKANTSTLDLDSATHPFEVADILEAAALRYRESASELTAGWQDAGAGRPWMQIAKELDATALKLRKLLK